MRDVGTVSLRPLGAIGIFRRMCYQWPRLGHEVLELRRCMYWISLVDAEETSNATSTTVYIPKGNVLDLDAMRRMMEAAAREEVL